MSQIPCNFNPDAWNSVFEKKRERKTRVDFAREDFANAPWQQMIDSGSYKLTTTKAGRNFRRKFRLPASLFDFVVATVLHLRLFVEYDSKGCGQDAFCRPMASLHVKILCVLRVLGSGCEFAAVYEGSLLDEQTVRVFFLRFVEFFSRALYKTWVHPPSTQEQLQETMDIYRRLGLPGAIGSTDCFHLFWDRCPAQLKVDCRNGRYKRCTLVWSVSNDHHRKLYSISEAFCGCVIDKTIQQYDSFLQSVHLRSDPLFANARFTLFDESGQPHENVGSWILCDNGYHKWESMQMPPSHCTSQTEVIFREVLESARKPTECVIGILKARFWMLKHPLRLKAREDITNCIYTCSVLHNMLLEFDGFDKLWTADDWLSLNPEDSDEEDETTSTKRSKKRRLIAPERLREYVLPTGESDIPTIVESNHLVLRSKLITNLKYLYDKGEVEHLEYPAQAKGAR
jgi:hypothetical protein